MELGQNPDPDKLAMMERMNEGGKPPMEHGQDNTEMTLDISQFPELKGKKEGETATVTFKITAIRGTEVVVEPYSDTAGTLPSDSKEKETMVKPGEGDLIQS